MSTSPYTTRIISHDEAAEIAQRLINSHFRNEPRARVSIDDDLLINSYIKQQRERPDALAAAERRGIDLPAMIPHDIERAIDQWAGEILEVGHASSWEYGELWTKLRAAILALSPSPPAEDIQGRADDMLARGVLSPAETAEERQRKIVAWLRKTHIFGGPNAGPLADAIERGEYDKEPTDG